jgi:adenine deaminase
MRIDRELVDAAAGRRRADLLLKNARVINVFDCSIEHSNVAIFRGRFIGLGDYSAARTIDLHGMYLVPGFIDGHCHIESSMLCPREFARTVLPHGTTAIVADPHEIANVLGIEGIRLMVQMGKGIPFRFFYTLPSCVPSSPLETPGAELDASALELLAGEEWVAGLGEVMNFPGVIGGDPSVLEKLNAFSHRTMDGHAPSLSGKALNAYVSCGIRSDHECVSPYEAIEKLRRGMWIMMRYGSAARNLVDLLPMVMECNSRRLMIVTDDRNPRDLIEEGHLDAALNVALNNGLDPLMALQMVTINPAQYFGLKDMGAIAPGFVADCVVLESLRPLVVRSVFVEGREVFRAGRGLVGFPSGGMEFQQAPLKIHMLSSEALSVPARKGRIRVIELVRGQIFTRCSMESPRVEGGAVVSDAERDILKVVVIERHRGTGSVGKGFVRGFGLREGAIASTVAHDSHNLIAVGVTDREIIRAAGAVARMGGGLVVVRGERVLAELPLPIGGLMSTWRGGSVLRRHRKVQEAARRLGSPLEDPFMALSFLALPVIPQLKITDKGLVDVEKFSVVDLFE